MFSYNIRQVKGTDISNLSKFLADGYSSSSSQIWEKRFSMWWSDNPIMSSSIPSGWILEKNESEIVGFIGNIPFKYLINGSEGIAVASSSWYVKPEVRGIKSIQLLMAFVKQKNVDLLLSTTPNEEVKRIFPKFGFKHFDLPLNNTEYWYIFYHKDFFDFFLSRKISSQILLNILKVATYSIKIISPFARWLQNKHFPQFKNNDFCCSTCTHCDESFTELWNTHKKKNLTTLYRDAVTLNWLYFSEVVADIRHVIKCTRKQDNKLVGYFVFDIINTKKKNVKILHFKDGYVPEADEKIFLSLISSSINLAKKYNASAVRFWSINTDMEKMLKKHIKVKNRCVFDYLYKYKVDSELGTQDHEFVPSPIEPDRGIL